MARLVVHIPAQTYSYELDDESAEAFRQAIEDEDEYPYAFDELADFWVSDTVPEMEVEFVE
jgi:hypothetical protein